MQKIKIVLINPRTVKASTFPTGEFFRCTAPNTGLAYISAVLEQEKHRVEIIDAQALGLDDAALREKTNIMIGPNMGASPTATTTKELVQLMGAGQH